MKKEFVFSLFLSIVVHVIVVVDFNFKSIQEDNTFSKNEGVGQSQVSVRVVKAVKKKRKLARNKQKAASHSTKNPSPQKQQSGSASTSSGNNKLLSSYLSLIRSKIAENKYKSKIAKKLNQRGKVGIGFKIVNNDEISDINILRPSNSKQLNFSAIRTIERIGKVPSIPKELNLAELTVDIDLSY